MGAWGEGSRSDTFAWTPTGEEFPRWTAIQDAAVSKAGPLVGGAVKETAEGVVSRLEAGTLQRDLATNGREATLKEIKGYYRQKWERKRDLGTAVHDAIEKLNRGKPVPVEGYDEAIRGHMAGFAAFVERYAPRFFPEFTEKRVANRTLGYCGKFDAICEIDGRMLLLDVKTGKPPRDGRGAYPEVALQINAYANAEFIGDEDGTERGMPEIHGGLVLSLRPKTWRTEQVALTDEQWAGCMAAVGVYRWVTGSSHYALLGELPEPGKTAEDRQREALEAFGIIGGEQ